MMKSSELVKPFEIPKAPFFGSKTIEGVSIKALLPYLNENMLFQLHWGFKKVGVSTEEKKAWIKENIRPTYNRMIKMCEEQKIITPKAVYGFWKCASEGDSVVLFDERGKIEVGRFSFPRQQKDDGLCIADFFHDVASNERDVVGLQVVTVGSRASEVEKQLMENDQYQDYLFLHGLAVELAEAMAEYVHKRIRSDLGFANKDADDIKKMIKQGYQGCRYSFGYPACPNISDQRLLLGLLRADRIGIKILENDMLEPEQSTSAFIAHHPQAKYFNV
ncbi:MAG: hypothetical protein KAJ75_03005 [Alphaproteobacteria bacterium]|nr:hypothetical protein [Alphaproteobacteria bacterium]